jgi:hypothetical protein
MWVDVQGYGSHDQKLAADPSPTGEDGSVMPPLFCFRNVPGGRPMSLSVKQLKGNREKGQ